MSRQQRKRKRNKRYCVDCGVELPEGNHRRCNSCIKIMKEKWKHEFPTEGHEELGNWDEPVDWDDSFL